MKPAGVEWCSLYPTSTSLTDLISPFRENCTAFITALRTAGASVSISATYRPAERAYLMHSCCMIAFSKADPDSIPPMDGVDIQWNLGNPADTIAACAAMAKTYGIVYPPALVSRHTQRRAIDMTITFSGSHLVLPHYDVIAGQPATLYAAGATYGAIKLLSDPPHWSDDGH